MRLSLGLHLVREGFVTPEQLILALDYQEQRRPRIGQLALRARKMNVKQVLDVLTRQSQTKVSFGQVAVSLEYLTALDVDLLLVEQRRETPRVGEILVMQGAIAPEILETQVQTLVATGVADDNIVL